MMECKTAPAKTFVDGSIVWTGAEYLLAHHRGNGLRHNRSQEILPMLIIFRE